MSRQSIGQSLVEFALVLPLMLLLIFGAIDFGRAIYAYSTAGEAARQAARLAIVDQRIASVRGQAINAAPVLGLTNANVDVCFKTAGTLERDCLRPTRDDCSSDLQIGCLAVVVVKAPYTPLTPMISGIVGPLTLTNSSLVPIEYVCPTATHPSCP